MSEQTVEPTQQSPPASTGNEESAVHAAGAAEVSIAEPAIPEGTGKLVPVGEAIKYRRRAQQAETRLQQIEQQLNEVQAQMAERLEQLATAEAQRDEMQHQLESDRARISAERRFHGAGVIDIDAAMTLLEKRIDLAGEIDGEQLAQAVDALLQDKPFLAAPLAALPGKTASQRLPAPGASAGLARAASKAASTGNARDLAAYLHLRRQAQNS